MQPMISKFGNGKANEHEIIVSFRKSFATRKSVGNIFNRTMRYINLHDHTMCDVEDIVKLLSKYEKVYVLDRIYFSDKELYEHIINNVPNIDITKVNKSSIYTWRVTTYVEYLMVVGKSMGIDISLNKLWQVYSVDTIKTIDVILDSIDTSLFKLEILEWLKQVKQHHITSRDKCPKCNKWKSNTIKECKDCLHGHGGTNICTCGVTIPMTETLCNQCTTYLDKLKLPNLKSFDKFIKYKDCTCFKCRWEGMKWH